MSRYIPVCRNQFRLLLIKEKGWVENCIGKEIVFDKTLRNGTIIRVFTSIRNDNGECRKVGTDAIRICAFNPSKKRGVARTKKINRVPGWENRLKSKVLDMFYKVK